MTGQEKKSILDEEHLRLLRIGYLIIGVAGPSKNGPSKNRALRRPGG